MIGKNNVRERIRSGELVVSCMLRFPNPAAAEIMALAGVDLMVIDNEHYPFNEETMIDLIRAADVHGMATVVRVPNCEPTRIAQIMDMGADGIWIPSCDLYEEAMQLVNAVKYAPLGTRGYCPITRANMYGYGMPADEFTAFSNEHSIVIVQIETKEGVEDLDRILTIPEIDFIDYGPSDLSASYGIPGKSSDPIVQNAIKEIISKSTAAGKPVARTAHSAEEVQQLLDEGSRIVHLGSDQQILAARARKLIRAVRPEGAAPAENTRFRGLGIKEKIRRGELVINTFVRLASPESAEMLAREGVDMIMIDNEHYPFDPEMMIAVARAANAGGAACTIRLPNVEPARIAQVMDMGMDGIWIPSVDSYEECKALVDAVKFAPVGKRGFCPITRAAAYGCGMTPEEYAEKSNENSLIGIQVETKEGVADIDRIVSIPELDVVGNGPSDLSASYGCPGRYDDPRVVEAIRTISEKAAAAGKVRGGMKHDPASMKAAYDAGERYLSLGSDQQMLMNEIREMTAPTNAWKKAHA